MSKAEATCQALESLGTSFLSFAVFFWVRISLFLWLVLLFSQGFLKSVWRKGEVDCRLRQMLSNSGFVFTRLSSQPWDQGIGTCIRVLFLLTQLCEVQQSRGKIPLNSGFEPVSIFVLYTK